MDHDHGTEVDGCVFYHALTFHTGVCQEILFPGWTTTNALEVFGSAVALFVAGFLYEGFKYSREVLYQRGIMASGESQVNMVKPEGAFAGPGRHASAAQYTMTSSTHLLQTLLHIIQTTVSYILMLVFMTYNVWLCMGLVLGMGAGYFVFGWRKSSVLDSNEHCQ